MAAKRKRKPKSNIVPLETASEYFHKNCVATVEHAMKLVRTKKYDGVVVCLTSRKGRVKTFWSAAEDGITAGGLIIRAGIQRIDVHTDNVGIVDDEEDDSG